MRIKFPVMWDAQGNWQVNGWYFGAGDSSGEHQIALEECWEGDDDFAQRGFIEVDLPEEGIPVFFGTFSD